MPRRVLSPLSFFLPFELGIEIDHLAVPLHFLFSFLLSKQVGAPSPDGILVPCLFLEDNGKEGDFVERT